MLTSSSAKFLTRGKKHVSLLLGYFVLCIIVMYEKTVQYKVRNVRCKKEVFNKIRQCYIFVSSYLRRSEGSADSRTATAISVGR